MPIKVKCSKCSKVMNLKDEYAGKKVRCPGCKAILAIPALKKTTTATQKSSSPAPLPKKSPPTTSAAKKQAATKKSAPKICPKCNRTLPEGEQSCPRCGYHLKLRRSMNIGSAIKSADMHSMGMNIDGSRKITRSDMAVERAEEEKKVSRLLTYSITTILILITTLISWFLYAKMVAPFSIVQLREQLQPKPLDPQNPESYNPILINIDEENISLTIPLENIFSQVPDYPTPWPEGEQKAWAAFAQATMAPLATSKAKFILASAEPVITRANEIGGEYSPASLLKAPPSSEVYIWRMGGGNHILKGYLRGAILDFSATATGVEKLSKTLQSYRNKVQKREKKIQAKIAHEAAMGVEMKYPEAARKYKIPQKYTVKIRGVLSFIPFLDKDMPGHMGSYRSAAENNSPLVRRLDTTKRDKKDLLSDNRCYFIPVVLVDYVAITKTK